MLKKQTKLKTLVLSFRLTKSAVSEILLRSIWWVWSKRTVSVTLHKRSLLCTIRIFVALLTKVRCSPTVKRSRSAAEETLVHHVILSVLRTLCHSDLVAVLTKTRTGGCFRRSLFFAHFEAAVERSAAAVARVERKLVPDVFLGLLVVVVVLWVRNVRIVVDVFPFDEFGDLRLDLLLQVNEDLTVEHRVRNNFPTARILAQRQNNEVLR